MSADTALIADLERRATLTLLKRERAALWSKITGHEYIDRGDHEALRLDGITPAEIHRVAAINAEIARL